MESRTKPAKVYVEVLVDFLPDGQMRPRVLVWEDGLNYEIDRIKDVRPARARRGGGQGDRYTIMVRGQERYLFFEHSTGYGEPNVGRWFLETR